ncbi:hypothetical protein QH639_04935 [Lysinibacillus sp. 1 U-2021]|uniref:hypothetical protein n=1 Tax=Lysinibacillus sp. 1 U-2021 TaxID=3039426 RepID=UPI0024801776|nr:hypothetical protein [Lysinibacillus sp. 1 U-2021]WGT40130.1 hypothetical protein QH639_04935 [Lysinibacillus sp. 1 U-2021]
MKMLQVEVIYNGRFKKYTLSEHNLSVLLLNAKGKSTVKFYSGNKVQIDVHN